MTNSREPSRPNAATRRALKRWMLTPEAGFGGDGAAVPCSELDCPAILTIETIFMDRIVPGEHGGRYVRANIKPHCGPCSHRQGQRRTVEICNERRNGCVPAASVGEKGREASWKIPQPEVTAPPSAPTPTSARNGLPESNGRSSPIDASTASSPAKIRKARASSRSKTTAPANPDLGV